MLQKFKKFTNNGYELYYLATSKVNVVRLEQTKDKSNWKVISYPTTKEKIDFNKSVLLAMVYGNKFKLLGVEFEIKFENNELILISPDNHNGSQAVASVDEDTIPF